MRNTRNWKHTTKRNRQYKENEFLGWYFNPYYDSLTEIGMDKRNTPFMDMSDIEEEDEL